jgi:hypothetical protein
MQRALEEGIKVTFSNNEQLHEFLVTIGRESNQVGRESNQVEGKSNQVGQESNQVGGDLVTKPFAISDKQRDILNFCSVPRTASEIMERMGLSNQYKNRVKYITPLVEAGYLELTNPEYPSASNQKYRKKLRS